MPPFFCFAFTFFAFILFCFLHSRYLHFTFGRTFLPLSFCICFKNQFFFWNGFFFYAKFSLFFPRRFRCAFFMVNFLPPLRFDTLERLRFLYASFFAAANHLFAAHHYVLSNYAKPYGAVLTSKSVFCHGASQNVRCQKKLAVYGMGRNFPRLFTTRRG